ncbi:hypothetical protein B0I35DRAFT_500090 [Stachybotrys elegans]|uniref:Rhodopsin domain-containing protein n=1 Tax=Stachybotrys elegans TaxID=80388 RepID=A0A8K0T0U3_9HYPO|nr:hypothetical protein B0I35DRAFT_500090 [Stachybotrys elegans]
MDQMPQTSGITPLPLKPETLAHVVAECIVHGIVFIVVALRIYCRMYLGSGVGMDDYMIIAATLLSTVLLGLILALQLAGAGYGVQETAHNLSSILFMTFIVVPFYLSTLLASKLSMLAFYLRIFERHSLKLWVFVTMGFCVVWAVGHFLGNVFICKPVQAQWNLNLIMTGRGTCGDQIPIFQSMIISNMLMDLIIMTLPLKTIWGLQMRFMEKLGLMMSFLLLGAVIIVGSVRVHYVSTVDLRSDLTKTMPISLFLTVIEPNFAILCVSIPMLRPIYRSYRARYGSSRGATKLSDHVTPNQASSGAIRSGKGSKKAGPDTIALYSINGDDDQTKFTTNIEVGSNQSFETEASARELTSPGGRVRHQG